MFFGSALIFCGWGNSGPAEMWHVLSTGYFCVLFLWAIAVSGFRPLEIYKNLCNVTFVVNRHADTTALNIFICFQILYSMKSVFLSKYTLRFFIFKFDLNVKHRLYFSNKSHDLQKKTFHRKKYEKNTELNVVHKWRHMQSE